MTNKLNELAQTPTQSLIRRLAFERIGAALAGMALASFALASAVQAQTSIVCDPAGDTTFSSGKGGPAVPPWLDIFQAEITTDGSGTLLFTLTMNAPIPTAPAWSGVDDGGQLWWGYRLVNNLTHDSFLKIKCIKSPGSAIPAGYFLDLIWDVTTSSFRARLLDDTTCAQDAVPFYFSTDRTQLTIVLSQALLSNTALIPDQNNFQFLAATEVWKADQTGNISFFTVDLAPNATSSGQLVAVDWSATANNTYFCR
jgi:hypothetical protein